MRLQLAINVPDIEAAIDYYSRLFGTEVAKRKPGYANFEVTEPPLKLVLFEGDSGDRLNHLGVEVFDHDTVKNAAADQRSRGLDVELTEQEGCCFASQNKAVSYAPDGTMWEWYQKLEDLETFDGEVTQSPVPTCCA